MWITLVMAMAHPTLTRIHVCRTAHHWLWPLAIPRHAQVTPMLSPRGSPPRQADEVGEGQGDQEIEDAQLVQLLPH